LTPHAKFQTSQPSPRLVAELSSKLQVFRQKFDEILGVQAEAMQLEHEPSQPLALKLMLTHADSKKISIYNL